jgi:AmmeMemoRadiSam system protein B
LGETIMRQPAVANQFYPGSPETLTDIITKLYPSFGTAKKEKAIAVVSPHAGYIYSGALAAETLSAVLVPESVIILGPNHRGVGPSVALSSVDWDMVLGKVAVDMEIGSLLLEHSNHIQIDEPAHQAEHSLEVQVPLLQLLQKRLTIVPLLISHIPYPVCQELAQSLAHAISQSGKDVLMVASSDMSHYEQRKSTEKKDRMALKAIEELNPFDLYQTVIKNRISMCGFIPVVIAMLAAQVLGANV